MALTPPFLVPMQVVWVAGSFVGSSSLGARIIDAHCHSYEYISEVDHPGNVELWLCEFLNLMTDSMC